ncbi:hypothetical protein RhiJN_16420 [Ceratobasidium sp. AG-Ba]|nr:hypothetical protein RhiJN_16420 [Ceratobasidium sp. AG-Ba]
MGTRGLRAYRYKNRYYIAYHQYDSYPDELGLALVCLIPRNAARREEWINMVISKLEATRAWRRDNGIKDDGWRMTSPAVLANHEVSSRPESSSKGDKIDEPCYGEITDSNDWILGDIMIEWTYVIDLDYRAFSVNGRIHFNLDNMPPFDDFPRYFDDNRFFPDVPKQYLTSVSYWSSPDCDIEAVNLQYSSLQPHVLGLKEWGAPSWTSLSAAQLLSVQLVKDIVRDNRTKFKFADVESEYCDIVLVCWQIACAAAPSHLICPSTNTSIPEAALHVNLTHAEYDYPRGGTKRAIFCSMDARNLSRVYCRFRGCLVYFCLRLDEETLLRHEINNMVEQLKKNGRIGKLEDGLLMMVHLLSALLTVDKTPWMNKPRPVVRNATIFADEILEHILRFTDDYAYFFALPMVSHSIRNLCLSRPRVGQFILTVACPDGTYQALSSTGPTGKIHMKLIRLDEKPKQSLVSMFQHYQTGTGRDDDRDALLKRLQGVDHMWHIPIQRWNVMVKGDELPDMRVQVVTGVWNMVENEPVVSTKDL